MSQVKLDMKFTSRESIYVDILLLSWHICEARDNQICKLNVSFCFFIFEGFFIAVNSPLRRSSFSLTMFWWQALNAIQCLCSPLSFKLDKTFVALAKHFAKRLTADKARHHHQISPGLNRVERWICDKNNVSPLPFHLYMWNDDGGEEQASKRKAKS